MYVVHALFLCIQGRFKENRLRYLLLLYLDRLLAGSRSDHRMVQGQRTARSRIEFFYRSKELNSTTYEIID